jgi:RNA polymerase sigma-70 factor (ECF subfamily)
MREAQMPFARGLRGLPAGRTEPAVAEAAGRVSQTSVAPDVWHRQRLEAFMVLDDARLLQSYRLATLILRDRAEAEDATQEAIARAWSCWGTLRQADRFDAWFDRILLNVCRNRMRHTRTLRVVALDDVPEPVADPHPATIARLSLEPAFARLSHEQRIIVVLRYWQDLSVDEIADRVRIPAGTVKSRLHYALETLRRALESSEEGQR